MQVWNMLHAAHWKYRMQKSRQKSPSGHHRTTLSGYIFATKARIDNWKENLWSSNMSSRCPHNMVNFGPLAAEISLPVWGTPANFNGFHVLAALLHGSQVVSVSQTLQRWTEAPPMFGRATITLAHILVVWYLQSFDFETIPATDRQTVWQRTPGRSTYHASILVMFHIITIIINNNYNFP